MSPGTIIGFVGLLEGDALVLLLPPMRVATPLLLLAPVLPACFAAAERTAGPRRMVLLVPVLVALPPASLFVTLLISTPALRLQMEEGKCTPFVRLFVRSETHGEGEGGGEEEALEGNGPIARESHIDQSVRIPQGATREDRRIDSMATRHSPPPLHYQLLLLCSTHLFTARRPPIHYRLLLLCSTHLFTARRTSRCNRHKLSGPAFFFLVVLVLPLFGSTARGATGAIPAPEPEPALKSAASNAMVCFSPPSLLSP
jgi:hypothetical protein